MPGPDRFPVVPAVRVVADPSALDRALAALSALDSGVGGGTGADGPVAALDDPARELEAASGRAAHRSGDGHWWAGRHSARLAPDDLLVVVADPARQAGALDQLTALVTPLDPHAIVEPESGFVGAEADTDRVRRWLAHQADWPLPPGDGLSQGMVAALPVKIVVRGRRALVLAPASLAHELTHRFDPAGPERAEGAADPTGPAGPERPDEAENQGGRW